MCAWPSWSSVCRCRRSRVVWWRSNAASRIAPTASKRPSPPGLVLQPEVFERCRVAEAGNPPIARLRHAGADTPDERLLEERDRQYPIADDLLDLVHHRLALLRVELARLADVEVV